VGVVVPLQARPLLQVRLSQQGCPVPPQAWQVSSPVRFAAHTVAAVVHRLFAQHGCPVLPQASHAVPTHTRLPAVQRSFEQQRSPEPPQRVPASPWPETHAPAEQVRSAPVPELAQALPAAAQVPPPPVVVQQQPPLLQRLPVQQASPALPQTWQVPGLFPASAHSAPAAVQVLLAQQGWFTPPQSWQVSPRVPEA
jgi:hypothetical protein